MNDDTVKKIESCEIQVDREGDWFYEGRKIFRPEILEVFYAKLDRLPTGEFVLHDFRGPCLLDVADTPFVISRIDFEKEQSGAERIMIRFKNISRFEILDPDTLEIGEDNVLYCRLEDRRYSAKFSRPAYYQLAEFIHEDDTGQGFHIELNGKRHSIGLKSEG